MSDNTVEEFTINGYTVKIERDDDAEHANPRADDFSIGVMLAEGHRNYVLGDRDQKIGDQESYDLARTIIEEQLNEGGFDFPAIRQRVIDELGATVVLPLWLIDHSGISMRTGPFSEDSGGWDSGVVGIIFDTPHTRKETGCKLDQIEAALIEEVKLYDQFLTGDVYGFVVENPDGEEVESCWGFLGLEYAKSQAIEAATAQPLLQWVAITGDLSTGVQAVHGPYLTEERAARDGTPKLLSPASQNG